MMKHSKFILLITISICSTGCFCVKTLPQSKLNPTEYVFPISKEALTDSLINKENDYFSWRCERSLTSYKKDSDYFNVQFTIGQYKKYSGSYVYRKGDSGKYHSYNFKMKIDSLSSDSCRVKIIYSKGNLITGIIKLGDRMSLKYKPIPSTTIEEYELLRKIGKRLGILKQMPLVNYPEGLTRDQIRMTYGHYQEFTYEEMFGEPQPEAEKDPVYTEKELKKREKKWLPLTKFDYRKYM